MVYKLFVNKKIKIFNNPYKFIYTSLPFCLLSFIFSSSAQEKYYPDNLQQNKLPQNNIPTNNISPDSLLPNKGYRGNGSQGFSSEEIKKYIGEGTSNQGSPDSSFPQTSLDRNSLDNSSVKSPIKSNVIDFSIGKFNKNEDVSELDTSKENVNSNKNSNNKGGFESDLVGSALDARSKDFFTRGSATDFYTKEAKLTESPKVHILNAGRKPFDDEPKLNGSKTPKPDTTKKPDDSKLTLAQKLERDFGQPTSDTPVLATDNAPKPFKAMMLALEGGDEDLAFKYAKQYIRYQNKASEKMARVMELNQLAMEREQVVPKVDRSEEVDYTGMKDILERDIAEEKKKNGILNDSNTGSNGNKNFNNKDSLSPAQQSNQSQGNQKLISGLSKSAYELNLDDRTRNILKKAELVEENQGSPEELKGPDENLKEDFDKLDEKTQRELVRATVTGKAPVDPRGLGVMYFFFRSTDENSFYSANQLEKLFKQNKENQNFKIVGFTIDRKDEVLLRSIQANRKISFELLNGSDLAKRLNIKSSPTVIVFAPTSGKAFAVEGAKPYVFYDELLKVVQGK